LAAGGQSLCSHKVTKGLSAEMLLCRTGLYAAKRAEPQAAKPYLYFIRSSSFLQVRFAMPLQPHNPPSFCPLSPEAVLLVGKRRITL